MNKMGFVSEEVVYLKESGRTHDLCLEFIYKKEKHWMGCDEKGAYETVMEIDDLKVYAFRRIKKKWFEVTKYMNPRALGWAYDEAVNITVNKEPSL